MSRIGGRKPAHHLYNPTSRKLEFPKTTYPMLVRTAANVARAFANVHASGCIVGDVNHSGVLVSNDATVTLIDCDSFQFSYHGRLYYCGVGVPEFTAPELQGKSLARIHRTANHDNFGLAVLIFYILMMGRHPFAGRYLGTANPPLESAIAEFRFAYSARRNETRMDPPPNVATLSDLPLVLRNAFEHAFGPSGASGQRPTATEWACILDRAEGEVVSCLSSPVHHYFQSARSCPLCRMESAYPGFQAFAPTLPVRVAAKLSVQVRPNRFGARPVGLSAAIAALCGNPRFWVSLVFVLALVGEAWITRTPAPQNTAPPNITGGPQIEQAVPQQTSATPNIAQPQNDPSVAENQPTTSSLNQVDLSLRCTPTVRSGVDPVVEINVSIHGKEWSVRHTLASGKVIDRTSQYSLHNIPDPGPPAWEGINLKSPQTRMMGQIVGSNGRYVYTETVFMRNKAGHKQEVFRNNCVSVHS
jgi:hypothetical protein